MLLLCIVLTFQVGYYYWHFALARDTHDYPSDDAEFNQMSIILFCLDLTNLLLFMSFAWGTPMHRALGHQDINIMTTTSATMAPYPWEEVPPPSPDATNPADVEPQHQELDHSSSSYHQAPLLLSGPYDNSGNNNHDRPDVVQERLALLWHDDAGTRTILRLVAGCLALYWVSDFLYFAPTFAGGFASRVTYGVWLAGNIGTIYVALTLVTLAFRILLLRLRRIEHQVQQALRQDENRWDDPLRDYATFRHAAAASHNGDRPLATTLADDKQDNDDDDAWRATLDGQVLQWSREYGCIRRHVHDIAHAMGRRLLVSVLLFVCEATSQLGMWEHYHKQVSWKASMSLVGCYTSNAIVLTTMLLSMASLVTACAHQIGPALAQLAVRHANVRMQCLATTFLQAPIKLHVGLFEVGPEYANAIALWFLALFLVVFGLKMPGEA